MLKRILLKINIIATLSIILILFTSCNEELPQITINKEETVLTYEDYNIVFMFSQVNKEDITVLDTIESLRNEHKFKSETIILDDDSEITSKLRTVVENNTDLVIGYGQGMAIVFDLFQDTYPETKFVVIDGIAQDEDIKSISFDNESISYALGVTIATAFDSNDFGYIGDFENDNNSLYKSGFIKGLHSINRNASIDIEYVESATDTQTAYEIVSYYQSMGVKFIMNATNPTLSKGIHQACLDLSNEGKHIYTNSFMIDTGENPYILSGIVKDYSYPTQLIVNEFLTNKFNSKNIEITTENEAFKLLNITEESNSNFNSDILNDNSIKAGRKALDDIKNKNLIL